MWDEITYQFANLNGEAVGVWEWISKFILHFTGCVITYPCWDWSQNRVNKRGSCYQIIVWNYCLFFSE